MLTESRESEVAADNEFVIRAYEKLWPDADRIRTAAYRCGGPRRPRRAADYLGFDLLDGGLRQVWALAHDLRLNAESRVLELGCGLGGPARFIAERYGCRVTGIDITPRQLAIARALTEGLDVAPQLRFVSSDARDLPFRSERFSHVYSIEALVHVSDKPAAINEAFRVLRPGGVLCIQDPIHDPELQIPLFERTLHPLSVEEYTAALEAAGFCEIAFFDCSKPSQEAYTLLSQLVSAGPISPSELFATFERLHPGLRPSRRRLLSPWRIRYTLRFMRNRYEAALELLEDPERIAGMRRMCAEIVSGYVTGVLKFYQICATRPNP